jgi:hypothetical protein
MGNEVRLTEWIQFTKRYLNGWTVNHPESPDIVSNPSVQIPKELDELFGLADNPHFRVLRHGAGVLVNDEVLFMIGAFRRRHPGDASYVEWEQRGVSVVRSFDGKVASWWMTRPIHTLPGLRLQSFQGHELGYLWDPVLMAHHGDYDRRAPGFWQGRIVLGKVFGRSVPIIRGEDGRRSFVVGEAVYTEESAGCTHDGGEIFLPGDDAVLGSAAAMSSITPASVSDAVLGTAEGMSSVQPAHMSDSKLGTPEAKSSVPAPAVSDAELGKPMTVTIVDPVAKRVTRKAKAKVAAKQKAKRATTSSAKGKKGSGSKRK